MSPLVAVEPSFNARPMIGDSEKQFAKQRESSKRAEKKRVNIERHIPRSLIQRSSLCLFSSVQYYHVPWRWPSAGKWDSGQSQSIVCHRHRQGEHFMISSLAVCFAVETRVSDLNAEFNWDLKLEARLCRRCLNASYVCKQLSWNQEP